MKPRTLALLVVAFAALTAFSHPGGLDGNGGHTDSKTGQYHTHRSPGQSPTSGGGSGKSSQAGGYVVKPAAMVGPQCSSEEADRRVQEYFRAANAGLAGKPLGAVHARKVSDTIKEFILQRDGHCIICGSTTKLEVDHKVALENGGTNDIGNLAALCDVCHTKKTTMDNSLRHHREKLRSGAASSAP
jgi:hypothetical protein